VSYRVSNFWRCCPSSQNTVQSISQTLFPCEADQYEVFEVQIIN
jgi:hypothetical protein